MTARRELAKFQRLLAEALRARNPAHAVASVARRSDLSAPLRAAARRIDGDGATLTALLISKLRFERLLRGAREAERWFDQDPRSFTAAFRAYQRDVPATAHFPSDEAKLFFAWCGRPQGH